MEKRISASSPGCRSGWLVRGKTIGVDSTTLEANAAMKSIVRLKEGRTALAFKAENAVDMETGAIAAVTTHGGAAATSTIDKLTYRR